MQEFRVPLKRSSKVESDQEPEFWTRMSYHRCTNCPLSIEEHPCCPTALDLQQITQQFREVSSHALVKVEVETPQRTYIKACDVQTGLRGLLGLVMATSLCPILGRFRSLARMHLPFATVEENLFRLVGGHLLEQYFAQRSGDRPDWTLNSLRLFLDELQAVNFSLKERIDAASVKDANLNALSSLGMMAMMASISVDDGLEELENLFVQSN